MSRKQKRWLVAGGGVVVLLIVIVFVLTHWMNSDSAGTVHVGTAPPQSSVTSEPVSLMSPYFTTLLPTGFSIKRHATSTNPDSLYTAFATTSSEQDKQVAITVATIPSSGLQGVGDYNLRTSQASTYQPYALPALPSEAHAFRTLSGPAAFTVFWPHGSIYIELAFSTSGGASLAQLQQAYQQVLTTWNWK